MSTYTTMLVNRGRGLVLSCQECGALVHHRTVHDAWHELVDRALLEAAERALEVRAKPRENLTHARF